MKCSIVLRKNGDIDKNLNLFFKKKDLLTFQDPPSSQCLHRVAPLNGRGTGLFLPCGRWHQGAFTFNTSVFKSGNKEEYFSDVAPKRPMERFFGREEKQPVWQARDGAALLLQRRPGSADFRFRVDQAGNGH